MAGHGRSGSSNAVTMNDEVEAAMAPFGTDVPPEKLPEVQKRAEVAFARAMRTRGLDASGYRILVHRNELVGPMCFVSEAVPGSRGRCRRSQARWSAERSASARATCIRGAADSDGAHTPFRPGRGPSCRKSESSCPPSRESHGCTLVWRHP